MKLADIFVNITKTIKSNSPEILTALGVSGLITTSYLTAKASFKANDILRKDANNNKYYSNKKSEVKEKTKLVWKCYIPPVVSGAVTVGCIVGASKANGSRTAAAVTAYSLTERAFSEYKEKVVEEIGKGKEQKVRDEIAQKNVSDSPKGSKEIVIMGSGQILCCELFTRRYFGSDMETLRKAQNDINARINSDVYVTIEEFYDLIGLSNTSNSSGIGWDSDKQMALEFSTVLTENGQPCLAFDYNYTKPLR